MVPLGFTVRFVLAFGPAQVGDLRYKHKEQLAGEEERHRVRAQHSLSPSVGIKVPDPFCQARHAPATQTSCTNTLCSSGLAIRTQQAQTKPPARYNSC